LLRSSLLNNIARYGLDARIGKVMLVVEGTSNRTGERISVRPGYSPVITDRRMYSHGDPVKDIDWKIYARVEQLMVKIREGYKQTEFHILVDTSPSMKTVYEQDTPSKFTTALTLAYIIGKLALKGRDRLFLHFKAEKIKIDSEGMLLENLLDMEADTYSAHIWDDITELKDNVFVISDYFAEENDIQKFVKKLSAMTRHQFLFVINDHFEKRFPFGGKFKFIDTESAEFLLAEVSDIKYKYHHLYKEYFARFSGFARKYGAKVGYVLTNEDPFNFFVKAVK
jgi:hypothetical protein